MNHVPTPSGGHGSLGRGAGSIKGVMKGLATGRWQWAVGLNMLELWIYSDILNMMGPPHKFRDQ